MSDPNQLSIADHIANSNSQTSRSSERLEDIDGAIDWEPLYRLARQVDQTSPEKGGRPRKPARWMVRALFLKHSYGLSDPELEDQLIDRLSFRKFVGLPLDQPVPDFTTFWNFQEDLIAQGLIDEMFAEINRQLEQQGLLLKQGTIVDAAMKQQYGLAVAKAKTKLRNRAHFLMGCMCWNIERSLRLSPGGNLASAAAAVPRA